MMINIITLSLMGILFILFIVLDILLNKRTKEIKKNFDDKFQEMKKENEESLKKIKENTDIVLDGLVYAQTKDKVGLINLITKKKELNQEVIEQIKKEVEAEEKTKEDILEPVKKDYTPVD